MSTTDETQLIYQALINVATKLDAISKDQTNREQGFRFRGIDDLLNACHPLLCEFGVVLLPEYVVLDRYDRLTKSQKVMEYVIVKGTFRFTASDGSSTSATMLGQASDLADKACTKAMSVALKYALIQVFTVPTRDMDDADATTEEAHATPPPIDIELATGQVRSETDINKLRALADTVPDAVAIGRLSAENGAKLEHAIETRIEFLDNDDHSRGAQTQPTEGEPA